MPDFVHLHNHTEFSLLDGAAKITDLVDKACDCGMPGVAITDHGNMFGVPKFVTTCERKGIKAIIGCEFYITADPVSVKTKENKRYHQILLAKNKKGYQNLVKLCSYGFTDGYYYKPRIDKETLAKHSEGLIASTCCLASEVNRAIIEKGEEEAEKLFQWYLDLFGEDYYVEIQRHNLGDMEKCNQVLLRWSKKYNVPVIATNDVHYVNKEDSEAHDLLLALQTASDYSDPNRFRFTDDYNNLNPNFYFKTPDEMGQLFADVPEALANTIEVLSKCENISLQSEMFLPNYPVPPQYKDMDEYLAAMVWERAKRRYPEMSSDISERIQHELNIIKKMGYAGYFLIVQSFTTEARNRGVYVGPGRGSAAGSVVAYALGIIDVDPIHYQLLFERFLNPERVSPPDIDIDFDDEGRQEVIDYVVDQYGRNCVSQVITYGTMGAKTALRDVGRTLNIPLAEVNRIAKLIPEKPGMTFKKSMDPNENPDFAHELEALFDDKNPEIRKMMRFARTLEGTARHTGVHACAVIITPEDVTNYVPISKAKDDAIVTQYDGPNNEMCGLLKMDFLGLKTLSIIKTAVHLVKENHGVVIDPEQISLDDLKTYELYQRGDTVATFQFESDGMRKYLKQLKPTNIEDLIAMNALYRPGPMDNIPTFINRKHGREVTEYPHPMLEPILQNTNGIMVYQEQIMQVAQKMAQYSLGQADLLRRAMGKKKHDVMAMEKARFVEGAVANGVEKKNAEDVFDTMAKFASYGFNKSHAAAYSVLAFRTGYMKAHYPAEYMAAVLTHNVSDITKITFFIEECRRMGIEVLQPDVNESKRLFSVNKTGQIRFGMEAIKGVGGGACDSIIEEREKNGPYESIFDLTSRVPSGALNRKVLENLAYAGAFDSLEGVMNRSQYFQELDGASTVLEKALSIGNKLQAEKASAQASLFGMTTEVAFGGPPRIPDAEEWPLMDRLNFEKDVIGFFLSGHPLDDYKLQIQSYCNTSIANIERMQGKEVKLAGVVTKYRQGMTKKGAKYSIFTLEDFSGAMEIALFNDDFAKFNGYAGINSMLYVSGNYRASWRDPNVFELKIGDVKFLEDVFATISSKLCLKIPLESIREDLIEKLDTLFLDHKGNTSVEFKIVDREVPGGILLGSRTVRVMPGHQLIQSLETFNIKCSLETL
ncbi:MAG: DNA polymerase III subunit alpha [Bacteroidia bacterium]|nr:DNA polymerase III subunit alpha [Bacteroidia bacterium]